VKRCGCQLRWPGGLTVLALPLVLLASGCGYSQKSLYSDSVQTVWVPTFENETFYRELQVQLTEALKKRIVTRTSYRLANSSKADTVLQGSIVAVDQKRLSRSNTGNLPQELELRVVIDMEWKDLRSGEVLRSRKGLQAVGRYIVSRPISEPIGTARQTAVIRLADAVVSVMRDDW